MNEYLVVVVDVGEPDDVVVVGGGAVVPDELQTSAPLMVMPTRSGSLAKVNLKSTRSSLLADC